MNNDYLRKILPILSLAFLSSIVIYFLYCDSIRYPILDKTVSYPPPSSSSKDLIAATQLSAYPNSIEAISLTVINNGSRLRQIVGVPIQFYYKGQWYSLKEPYIEEFLPPAKGISISPGGEISLEVGLGKYGLPLRAGHYRVVVEIVQNREYVIAEFDITK